MPATRSALVYHIANNMNKATPPGINATRSDDDGDSEASEVFTIVSATQLPPSDGHHYDGDDNENAPRMPKPRLRPGQTKQPLNQKEKEALKINRQRKLKSTILRQLRKQMKRAVEITPDTTALFVLVTPGKRVTTIDIGGGGKLMDKLEAERPLLSTAELKASKRHFDAFFPRRASLPEVENVTPHKGPHVPGTGRLIGEQQKQRLLDLVVTPDGADIRQGTSSIQRKPTQKRKRPARKALQRLTSSESEQEDSDKDLEEGISKMNNPAATSSNQQPMDQDDLEPRSPSMFSDVGDDEASPAVQEVAVEEQQSSDNNGGIHSKRDYREEDYVAVFYDQDLYIGRIISIQANGKYMIKFLHQVDTDSFMWPSRQDQEEVEPKFIFAGPLTLVGHGPFTVEGLDTLRKKYQGL